MSYREHAVRGRWHGLVECGWASPAPAAPYVQQVLPDGCMDLVWTGTELLVAGPDTGPHPSPREAGRAAAGLRFAPGVLPALLAVPAAEIRDRRVPLEALRPGLGRETADALATADGSRALRLLAGLAAALPGPPPEPAVRAAAGQLAAGATVDATADALGWTTRSLHRRCLAAFGYGPAVLRRVLRFRRVSSLLHAGVPIAEAAARAGYADQPHLSREVRALAGLSPAALIGPT